MIIAAYINVNVLFVLGSIEKGSVGGLEGLREADDYVEQCSPIFLAPGTSFMEKSFFFTEQHLGMVLVIFSLLNKLDLSCQGRIFLLTCICKHSPAPASLSQLHL